MLIGNRYQLGEKLGVGGMGTVYRAADRLTGQTIALKQVLSPQHDEDMRLSISQEFRTLASLRHPNVIGVRDYGFDLERQPYFTMDLVENARYITDAGRDASTTEKVRLLVGILQALAYVHRRGIVHRDVKPANILVDGDGRVKVLDFGLAVRHTTTALTAADTAGTVSYMAPELFLVGQATAQSDLYAVGIIAYELFTGRHPYGDDNPTTMIHNILSLTPDTSMLDDELAKLLQRLLEKSPEARYQTAETVISALCDATDQSLPEESAEIRESFLQASTFVGRELEFTQLRLALNAAIDGRGTAWLVGGESGVGKSRLLEELRIQAMVQGALVLRGQAVADGRLPYQMWRNIVRRLALSTAMNDTEAAILKDIAPDIDTLLGRAVPEAPQLDGKLAQQRLMRVIEDIFQRQNQPIVLLLEDLQWASESLEPLKQLTANVTTFPWLIVGSYRDEEESTIPDQLPAAKLIKLPRLSDREIEALSAVMLGEAGKQAHVIDLIRQETEGNTLFMIEIARALAEEAGTLGAVGQRTLPAKVMSGGIRQMLKRRLARVPAWAHQMLNLAAVAGRQIDLDIMRAAHPDIDWDNWLNVCANAAVLDMSDGVWRFAHDKLRETLLAELPPRYRPALHHAVAEAIESVYHDDDTYAEPLTEHWYAAGNGEKTLHYTLKAADRLVQITADYGRAQAMLQRGLLMPESQPYRPRLWMMLGDIVWRRGLYQEAEQYYGACLDEVGDDHRTKVLALNHLSLISFQQGNLQLAEQRVRQALAAAQASDNLPGTALSLNRLGLVLLAQENFVHAREFLEQSLEMRRKLGNDWQTAGSISNLGIVAYIQGEYAQSRQYFEESLAINRAVGDYWRIARGLNNLGFVAYLENDYPTAKGYLLEAIDIWREINSRGETANSLINLAFVEIAWDKRKQAQHNLLEGLQTAWVLGALPLALNGVLCAARLTLVNGDVERAAVLTGLAKSHPSARAENKRPLLDPLLAELEKRLGKDPLNTLLSRGAALDLNTLVPELIDEIVGAKL